MPSLPAFSERNPVLLRELREIAYLQPQELVGGKTYITGHQSARFHTLGSMYSQALGRTVHMGSKTKKSMEHYFRSSLSNTLLLDKYCPELSDLLPLAMGAVLDDKGNYVSMFMEDYSQGNTSKICEMVLVDQSEIPESIKRFMEPPDRDFHYDDLAKAFVFVDGKLRILDLDQLPWLPEQRDEHIQMRVRLTLEQALIEPHLVRA